MFEAHYACKHIENMKSQTVTSVRLAMWALDLNQIRAVSQSGIFIKTILTSGVQQT